MQYMYIHIMCVMAGVASFCTLIPDGLSGLPPSQSWPTKATPTSHTHSLESAHLELQMELDKFGITDPLEKEFGNVVKKLMDSCSKDSIAVSKHTNLSNLHQYTAFIIWMI